MLLSIAMAVGPVLGYVDQLRMFRQSRSSRGFPLAVCAVLLISSILRIFFWFGRRFDPVLLVQSCLMIAVQMLLLYDAVRFRDPEDVPRRTQFWQWPTYSAYVRFLTAFTGTLAVLQLVFGTVPAYIELVGALALSVEALLPLPQVRENARRRSTAGLSPVVLATWVGGDAFKTYYYVSTGAPAQFLACGVFQLSMDAVLLVQRWIYGAGEDAMKV